MASAVKKQSCLQKNDSKPSSHSVGYTQRNLFVMHTTLVIKFVNFLFRLVTPIESGEGFRNVEALAKINMKNRNVLLTGKIKDQVLYFNIIHLCQVSTFQLLSMVTKVHPTNLRNR